MTVPRPEQLSLRQVEFLPLSGKRVLAILVINDREVQNRVIHTDREYEDTELTQAANYINQEFGGKSLLAIRTGVLDSMQHDKDRLDAIMQTALDVASKTFAKDDEEANYVVTGESNLVESLASVHDVRDLFDAFTRKGGIVHLLDRCLETDGIQLFIGEESGYRPFDDYSLITARYEVNGDVAGVLGVIGPTPDGLRQGDPGGGCDRTVVGLGHRLRSLGASLFWLDRRHGIWQHVLVPRERNLLFRASQAQAHRVRLDSNG